MAGFQSGKEDPRQLANTGCVAKILLHEYLNTAPACAITISHTLGHFDLQIKAELICCAACNEMQMTAHRPEKALGAQEFLVLFGAKNAQIDQICGRVCPVHIFRNPVERLKIPQPAFAFFHIGFDHIALAALFQVACFPLLQFGLDKFTRAAGEKIRPQSCIQIIAEGLITAYPAVFQHRRPDGVIFFAKPQTVFDCAGRMTDL